MSERHVVDCDGCGARDIKSKPLHVTVDRAYNGVETEDHTVRLDLCSDCLLGRLKGFTDRLSHEEARAWVELAKRGKR